MDGFVIIKRWDGRVDLEKGLPYMTSKGFFDPLPPLCPQILQSCRNIPARLLEGLAEILRFSAFLGWAVEHIEGDSRNSPQGCFYKALCTVWPQIWGIFYSPSPLCVAVTYGSPQTSLSVSARARTGMQDIREKSPPEKMEEG